MLDIASKIVALIVAAIGAATTIFNVFFKGERKRKQAYYDNLLKPFAIECKKDPNINTVAFVQSRAKREDDSIPKYVFFLLDEQEKAEDEIACQQKSNDTKELSQNSDRLKMVLIDDYLNLYPNEYNKKRNLFEAVHKVIDYLMFLMAFLFIIMGSFVITSGIIVLISFLFAETPTPAADWWSSIIDTLIGIAIAFAGLIPIKISEWLSKDMYVVKKSCIQKVINKKVSRYNKRFDNYVL